MRPGVTGLWQISARSDPSMASRIHFDTVYVTGWSLLMDAKIMARTIPAVLLGRGGSVQMPPSPALNGSIRYPFSHNGFGHANGGHASSHRAIGHHANVHVIEGVDGPDSSTVSLRKLQ
jgi:hypothetical protein